MKGLRAVWKVRDRVRLVREVGGIPAGSEGAIFGFLRRPEGDQLAVTFVGGRSLIVEYDDVEPVSPAPGLDQDG
jgi:hypothetical protein